MIYLNCALTVFIEVLFFAVLGYGRREHFIMLCAAVNVATNLTLNLLLGAYYAVWGPALTVVLEVCVVVIEYAVYALAYGRSRRLFFLTVAANLLSFLTGVLLYGL